MAGAGGESEISCCVKYSVFGFNVLFFLIGFGLLLIGTWAQIEKNNIYSHLNKVRFFLSNTSNRSIIFRPRNSIWTLHYSS